MQLVLGKRQMKFHYLSKTSDTGDIGEFSASNENGHFYPKDVLSVWTNLGKPL